MKTVSTESSVTIEQNEDRRQSQLFRKIVELWPLWLVLLSGIAASFKFYFTVTDLAEAQKKWQENSEARREKTHDTLDSLDNRIIRLEKDVEWLKAKK